MTRSVCRRFVVVFCGVAVVPGAASSGDDAPPPVTTAPATPTSMEAAAEVAAPSTFTNPIYRGADPWVIRNGDHYYLCASENDLGIAVYKSPRLTDRGEKQVVWRAPQRGWNARQVWAPELHRLDGHWYIYYAASDGDNRNHRAGVLAATTDDPQGPYQDRGILYTGDDCAAGRDNRWAIDATPLLLGDQLYLLWSGWPADEDVQYLYIARMENPWTVGSDRVRICDNADHLWERVDEDPAQRGLNEGPQVLRHGGRVFVVYSCSGSWQPSYKLALLELTDPDQPLNPKSWQKHDRPVLWPTDQVYGIGHASFTTSPDGREDWIVYHAKLSRTHGWDRAVWAQPFTWRADGLPDFGQPVPAGRTLPTPTGTSER